jgi:hypothetical protein
MAEPEKEVLTKQDACFRAQDKVRELIPWQNAARVAREAGIDNSRLNRWLNEKAGLFYWELFRLARSLDVTMDYLCDDTQPTKNVTNPSLKTGKVIRSRDTSDLPIPPKGSARPKSKGMNKPR